MRIEIDKNLFNNSCRMRANEAFQQQEAQAYKKFRLSSYLAEMYLLQRSKTTWIKLDDDNSKYFFFVIKHRKLKQVSVQLKDNTGTWISDPTTVANLFVE